MARRQCSEWSEANTECKRWLGPQPTQKTCSPRCRNLRARRIKREQAQRGRIMGEKNALPEHLSNLKAKDTAVEVMKEELRPIVRESITNDVVRAIDGLVKLTPRAVELIAQDMEHPDPAIRQKAYTLLMRYSVGHSSVAPPPTTPATGGMVVNFMLPRPGDDPAQPQALPAAAEELKTCQECQAEKPAAEFVGDSERCQACHDAFQAEIKAKFGG